VAVWDRVLSGAEIEHIYQRGLGRFQLGV